MLPRPEYLPQHPFYTTFSLCSSLSVRGQIPHPKKIACTIIVLCTLIFIFLGIKLEDKYYAPNDSKHSLSSLCCYFGNECNFDWLGLFQTFEQFHSFKGYIIYRYVVVLHSGQRHYRITWFSRHLLLDQSPYQRLVQLLCFS